MGVYVKAVKKSETNKIVTYAYGDNPEHLGGIIELSAEDLSWKIEKQSSEKNGIVLALTIIPRITLTYKATGEFPDVVYKQS